MFPISGRYHRELLQSGGQILRIGVATEKSLRAYRVDGVLPDGDERNIRTLALLNQRIGVR